MTNIRAAVVCILIGLKWCNWNRFGSNDRAIGQSKSNLCVQNWMELFESIYYWFARSEQGYEWCASKGYVKRNFVKSLYTLIQRICWCHDWCKLINIIKWLLNAQIIQTIPNRSAGKHNYGSPECPSTTEEVAYIHAESIVSTSLVVRMRFAFKCKDQL